MEGAVQAVFSLAGDSFIGALVYELAQGKEIKHAIRVATVAASITVERFIQKI